DTNSAGKDGLFYGGGLGLLGEQALAVVSVMVFSFVATTIIARVIGLVSKNRVTEEDEIAGLDVSLHGESAYETVPMGGGGLVPAPQPVPGTLAPEVTT
ncbi:MAG: ammonium transporter, partial [Mycobacteriales bacterium]